MDTLFKSSNNFASLSLKDLIEARDLFHYHLMNKKNVVATAVGLYRIRKDDPWPDKKAPGATAKRKPKSERRTLFNSEVRPYSWPCVYAFVSNWQYEEKIAESDPSDVVPRTLYLPDGRTVPVCVIEAKPQPFAKDLKIRGDGSVPRNLLGPGTAIVDEDGQGMPRLATAGCIVRDGDRYYAMTNRHAVGAPGTEIKALQSHHMPVIGKTAQKGLTRLDLGDVYPAFHASGQRLLMDVGLVDVDDMLQWKTTIPGIAPVGPVLDLYDNSLSLALITMKAVGLSAVSGMIRGEIHALFYRYKALGGSEYLSDFLIGPETYTRDGPIAPDDEPDDSNVSFAVHHGDSGTLLLIEHTEPPQGRKQVATTTYYPFALLWGKEEFFRDGTSLSQPYALATSLSTALDQLDLDLVRDVNLDQEYIWGWVGHYAIGRALALPKDLIAAKGLAQFIARNLGLLALDPDSALDNNVRVQTKAGDAPTFVPLADVPDNVWKSNVNFTMVPGDDGKKHHKPGPGNRGGDDNPNHFADLDLIYKDGKTFLALNVQDPDTYLNPKAWLAYFAAMKPTYDKWAALMGKPADSPERHWGALPFRVHQLFDIMVAAAKEGDPDLFLCAGGTLIHYVGDACQPLHASYLSQGDPARVVKAPRSGKPKLEADGVHSGYEDDMIAYGCQKKGLKTELAMRVAQPSDDPFPQIRSGHDAAKAIIALIAATQEDLKPADIVAKWVALKTAKDKPEAMWDAFGDKTIDCMARGTRVLAALWAAAWRLGGGEDTIGTGRKCDPGDLMALYNDPGVLPSLALDHYPDDQTGDWSRFARPAPRAGTRRQ